MSNENFSLLVMWDFLCFWTDNKRLDEWVSEDRLDRRKVQWPKKDGAVGTTGTVTVVGSRPASPAPSCASLEGVTSSSLAAAIQKKQAGRKRKAVALDLEVNIKEVNKDLLSFLLCMFLIDSMHISTGFNGWE